MRQAIDKTQGYVLMWRSIMNTAIWENPKLERVYHWVMYRANWEEKNAFPSRNKVALKPGQFVTSLPHAAKELKMGQATADAYLNILKSESIIDRYATSKYTVITVQNWDWLQNPDRKTDSKRIANGEQTETDNTVNTLNTKIYKKENKHGVNTTFTVQEESNIQNSSFVNNSEKKLNAGLPPEEPQSDRLTPEQLKRAMDFANSGFKRI